MREHLLPRKIIKGSIKREQGSSNKPNGEHKEDVRASTQGRNRIDPEVLEVF